MTKIIIKNNILIKILNKIWKSLNYPNWSNITQIKEEKRLNKLAVMKEKKRRAKKITMTVGELEDKLYEASNDY